VLLLFYSIFLFCHRLQVILNSAARAVTNNTKLYHSKMWSMYHFRDNFKKVAFSYIFMKFDA